MVYAYEYNNNNELNLICSLDYESVNEYAYNMLYYNNKKEFVLPVWEQRYDDYGLLHDVLVYNINGYVSLKDFVNRYANYEKVQALYAGLNNVWDTLNMLSISNRQCLWDSDYIYVDVETGEPRVLCIMTDCFVSVEVSKEDVTGYISMMTGVQGEASRYEYNVVCGGEASNYGMQYDNYPADECLTSVLTADSFANMQMVSQQARSKKLASKDKNKKTVKASKKMTKYDKKGINGKKESRVVKVTRLAKDGTKAAPQRDKNETPYRIPAMAM